jgi:hypothetical protein
MKLKIYLCFLLLTSLSLLSAWSPTVTESFIMTGIPDLIGGIDANTATVYARFQIVPTVGFKITGPDVWAVYDLYPGEDVSQEEPIIIENIEAALLDLAFHIGDEDIVTAPDAEPWISRDTWTMTSEPSRYTLGLILCDPTVTTGPDITEFETDDILRPGSPVWYLASGRFRPFSSSLVYEHEGAVSLALLSATGMNRVHAFFRLQINRSGSLDDYPHAARVTVTCRLSSG